MPSRDAFYGSGTYILQKQAKPSKNKLE